MSSFCCCCCAKEGLTRSVPTLLSLLSEHFVAAGRRFSSPPLLFPRRQPQPRARLAGGRRAAAVRRASCAKAATTSCAARRGIFIRRPSLLSERLSCFHRLDVEIRDASRGQLVGVALGHHVRKFSARGGRMRQSRVPCWACKRGRQRSRPTRAWVPGCRLHVVTRVRCTQLMRAYGGLRRVRKVASL